ncbi:dihydrodipicolinate synthase family protein [Devosia neptuniae]|uniref:Dihydrodipicolinate synthase family protein n=1 Tax=Devosia neptuniae TaxID=191302 RepID=A0ABY6CPI6_9HYPH|nr:dihydrodipicolinate synthase family protein [Devosia neptuniae]UXN71908.1 dihydrodipicolinate synthase family protein [Devosia neptuniae]
MQKSDFRGVLPAITTKMTADQQVDLDGVKADVVFQIEGGVDAIVVCGSLGEASSLTVAEKLAIAKAAIEAAAGRVPVLLTIAEDSTSVGAALAAEAEKIGVEGLMVLPAMRYLADDREVVVHYRAIAAASNLPIIVYNNPLAYGINITAEMLKDMADEPKFVAIKESTGDTRRINETINALGDRYQLLTGVDDLALESLVLGCHGWIAGLVVAFPKETVAIYKLVQQDRIKEAMEIYRWFLPLLHLDIGPKFVQNIKLCEAIVRGTSPVVRQPRLELVGDEEKAIRAVVEQGLKTRPDLAKYGF